MIQLNIVKKKLRHNLSHMMELHNEDILIRGMNMMARNTTIIHM